MVGLRGHAFDVGEMAAVGFWAVETCSEGEIGLEEELAVDGDNGDEFWRLELLRGVTSMEDMLAVLV